MPSTEITTSATARTALTLATRSRVPASPCRCLYSARIGTKACENAPSANSRRRMFGRRNAASKASICSPAPNANAFRLSRASPVIRDSSVIALIVDSALSRFIDGSAWIRAARARCRLRERSKEIIMHRLFCPLQEAKVSANGQHFAGSQARPSGRSAAQAQHEPQIGAAQRDQEREEGDRRGRQGGGAEGTSAAAVRDRPG